MLAKLCLQHLIRILAAGDDFTDKAKEFRRIVARIDGILGQDTSCANGCRHGKWLAIDILAPVLTPFGFFLLLRRRPDIRQIGVRLDDGLAKDMGMAADDLPGDAGVDVLDGEGSRLVGDLGVQHDEQKEIAQFLGK